jgi:myxalamid-type polyketide synthase MxaE and MxaD
LAHPAATAPTARPGAGDPDESRGAGPIPGRPRDSFRDLPSGEERRTAIEVLTRECVAAVARIPIGGIDLDARLRSFGVDSLMALELRSSLEARLGVALPSKIILNNPTVRELVPLVADCVGIPLR